MADQIPSHLPLAIRLKLSIGSFLLQFCIRSDATVNRRLLRLIDPKTPPNSTGNPVSTTDISVDPSRNLWFRLFIPTTAKTTKLPLVIYFHGGGFAIMSADSKACDELCRALAVAIPAVIASVNYRLTPKHKYPCQYDDGFDALQFIISNKSKIVQTANTDMSKLFLAGDSAGGNIAHHVALRACQNPEIALAGLVLLQPFFGGEGRTEAELRLTKAPLVKTEGADLLWRMLLPPGADRNHPAANVLGSAETVEQMKGIGFPRSMVVVGGYDPLQDWQRRYAEGLKKCGKEVETVEYPNAFHGFFAFRELPEFGQFVEDLRKFVHNYG